MNKVIIFNRYRILKLIQVFVNSRVAKIEKREEGVRPNLAKNVLSLVSMLLFYVNFTCFWNQDFKNIYSLLNYQLSQKFKLL